jgi:hypothetical protein
LAVLVCVTDLHALLPSRPVWSSTFAIGRKRA